MNNYQEYQVRVFANGNKYWHQNGQLHREDGPAIECTSGYKAWHQNGKLHRIDGPAIEYTNEYDNGTKYWYLKGINLSEQEFLIQTQPQPSHPCADKVVEIDGKKFKLTLLP